MKKQTKSGTFLDYTYLTRKEPKDSAYMYYIAMLVCLSGFIALQFINGSISFDFSG